MGWELERTLAPLGEVAALGRAEADLSNPERLSTIVGDVRPQVVVNAAAYTDVDGAENEPKLALLVNATAPGALAEAARKIGAALVHFSTDYVFDGTKLTPYIETDAPSPINNYGRSKLEGEQAIQAVGGAYLILRTSWVYSLRRESFVTKVLRWARERESLEIVDDQVGSPTWARMLAEATGQILAQGAADIIEFSHQNTGLYHIAGLGAASRLEWAKAILRYDPKSEDQLLQEVLPAQSIEFPEAARRPPFSALDCRKFMVNFRLHPPKWEEELRLALEVN